uniref:PDZ domain-containing protein n=1 Tax=Xiphophorus couchianus TaxID=32473 RepID=A0A3B5MP47_9TELE
ITSYRLNLSLCSSDHSMALTLNLIGPSPWGFRIYGGRDFKKAITVSKVLIHFTQTYLRLCLGRTVNGGSKAEKADLHAGDIILEINGENTADMLNVEAQNKIKNSKTHLQAKNTITPWLPGTMPLCSLRPVVDHTNPQGVFST